MQFIIYIYQVSIQSCISYNQSYIHITYIITQIHISHRHTIYHIHIPSKHTVVHIIQPIIYTYHIHNQSKTYITQVYNLSYTNTKLAYSHTYHTTNHICISHKQSVFIINSIIVVVVIISISIITSLYSRLNMEHIPNSDGKLNCTKGYTIVVGGSL